MKVWHDDCRPAPKGWVWAQNNEQAKQFLRTGKVDMISLDHDLGATPSDGIYAAGPSLNGSGYDLARWMVEWGYVPLSVTIHSWNPVGAQRMASVFQDAGYPVTIARFTP